MTYTKEEIFKAWYDYHRKKQIKKDYIFIIWQEFAQHLTQEE